MRSIALGTMNPLDPQDPWDDEGYDQDRHEKDANGITWKTFLRCRKFCKGKQQDDVELAGYDQGMG